MLVDSNHGIYRETGRDVADWHFSSVSAGHHFGSDRRHSRHWLACCWLGPVASDPPRKSSVHRSSQCEGGYLKHFVVGCYGVSSVCRVGEEVE